MRRAPPPRALLAIVALALPFVVIGAVAPEHAGGPGPAAGPGTDVAAGPGQPGPGTAPDRPDAGPAAAAAAAGPYALDGVVVDRAGQAVADAEVSVRLELGPGVRGAAAATVAPLITTRTGADGAFVLAGLAAGRHHVIVRGGALFPSEVRFVAVPAEPLRVVVARQVSVRGRVVDGARPVAAAEVELVGAGLSGRRVVQADAGGAFEFPSLPEGTYRLRALRGDLASRTEPVPRLGPGPHPDVVLVAGQAAIVVGNVVDADTGAGVAAAVELRSLEDDGELARYGVSGSDGVVRIEGVLHGRWIAQAWAPGLLDQDAVELDAGRGLVRIEVARGAVLSGRVVGPDGRPVAGATIRVESAGDGGAGAASAQIEADRLARFTGAGAGGGAGPVDQPLAAFEPRGELGVMRGPIPFPPPPGARIGAPIEASLGAPGPGVVGRAPPPPPLTPVVASTWISDSDGRFRAAGVGPGRVVVRVSAVGFADGVSRPVAASPPDELSGLEVTLARGRYLVGRILDDRGDVVVGAILTARTGAGALDHVTDSSGAYRIGPLQGTVELAVTAFRRVGVSLVVDLDREDASGPDRDEVRRDLTLALADRELIGEVVDPAGLPVVGAQIVVVAGAAAGRAAVSTAAGFRLTGLPAGPVELRVEHADYPSAQASTSTDERPRLTLRWGGGVTVQVHDRATGAPLVGVTVEATGPGPRRQVATDPRGWATLAALPAGTWTLRVASAGYLPSERRIDVAAGTGLGAITVDGVELTVERGAHLAGLVRDRRGERVAGAEVVAQRADGSGASARGRSNADGEFHLRDAPTGTIRVEARAGGGAGATTLEVRPGDEQFALVIDLQ
ncbi:MAG: carboxypeptidase regulatory-like domain-containing protein [Kofleriaceae bacterium]|nr:carboxypeptidase regulatory-like domain-containing protein [Kofleriaceae bacterium]